MHLGGGQPQLLRQDFTGLLLDFIINVINDFATAGLYLEPAYDGYNYGVAIERPLELRAAEDGRLMLLFRAVYDDVHHQCYQ